MKNSHLCNIKFKKRQLARLLEVRDGISWSFNKVSHFDPYINLRAAIPKPITIKAHTTVPVPTGVTPELNSPNYKMQVTTVSKLAIEKGIIVLDSPATLDYSFRGEIWVMLHNISNEDCTIRTNQFIAQLSVEPVVRMNIDYVDEIETDTPSLGMVRWIYDYIHNRFKSEKKEQYATEKYSKEKILKILNLTDSEIEELESIEKSEKENEDAF